MIFILLRESMNDEGGTKTLDELFSHCEQLVETLSQVNSFPRQSLKIFTFRVKLSDSICFLLGLSPIVKLIRHEKQILLSILRRKYCLIHLEIVKKPKK